MTKRRLISVLVWAAVLTLALSAAVCLLLRNISAFLTPGTQFAAIFSQLRTAEIRPPFILLYVLSAAYCFPASRWKRPAAAAVGLPAALLLLVLGMMAASVNGILFGDVLRSLLDVVSKGGLEGI